MLAVKNFFLPERKAPPPPDTPKFSRMPESFLRSIRRRSLRVKRTKSLVVSEREKRKSDSFVNSQEWTISRAVPDIRLGIVGSLSSGKSALVHRYLTGTYMQEESPEGGRFKKEVFIDNQSYLLLIRDEGGPPEMQFTAWVDAVIFVFSLENEASFNAVYNYYTKMSHFRNSAEIPIILVGTQDAISDRSPRVIDDSRARKLASDLKRCSYYETCATYGLNVDRVFHDACQKIVQQRLNGSAPCLTPTNSRPTTPQGTRLGVASFHHYNNSNNNNNPNCMNNNNCTSNNTNNNNILISTQQHQMSNGSVSPGGYLGVIPPQSPHNFTLPHRHHSHSQSSHQIPIRVSNSGANNNGSMDLIQSEQMAAFKWGTQPMPGNNQIGNSNNLNPYQEGVAGNGNLIISKYSPTKLTISTSSTNSTGSAMQSLESLPPPKEVIPPAPTTTTSSTGGQLKDSKEKISELPTPTSTPTTSRKSRRRSNLFIPSSKKGDDKLLNKNGEVGSGRAIPLKQGYLYKRSSKSLNKEWKKKYVTLCDDGRLTYHPSLHDYMNDVHGKEIQLQLVTVKVPGQKPRGSKSIITNSILNGAGIGNGKNTNGITESIGGLSLAKEKKVTEKVLLTAFDTLREPGKNNSQTSGDEGIALSNSNSQTFLNSDNGQKIDAQTPNVKKRHRRMKSSGVKNNEYDDSDGYEFYIVSLGNKQWHFEAGNSEERDEWVVAIEQEIFKSLQGNESTKSKQPNSNTDVELMQSVRSRVPGNGQCADCDASNPDWASLNLGILMCIECSGVHRNLGSHISKVRSLGLDEWTNGNLSVMQMIGNEVANSVWEANLPGDRQKPSPTTSREVKEAWIRSKYEAKEFLMALQQPMMIGQQLMDAILRMDIRMVVLCLAHMGSTEEINTTVSGRDLRTALHIACSIGSLAIVQLLILYNANIQQTDHDGKTCLNYAKEALVAASAQHQPTESIVALIDLLMGLGCTESAPPPSPSSQMTTAGTLPRRRELLPSFDKHTSSIL